MNTQFKIILIVLLLIVTTSMFANWQDLTAQGKKDLRSANMHFGGKRIEKALPLYESVLEDNPNHIETLEKVAGIYFDEKKDYLKANDFYEIIINSINEKLSEYEELKATDEKEAKKVYKKEIKKYDLDMRLESAIKFKGYCWTKLFLKAQKKFQNEDYENAIIDFNIVYDIAPDSIKTIKMISYVYNKMGNSDKSLEYMIKAAELDPTDDMARTQIANTYFEIADKDSINDYGKAIEWYEKAAEINAENVDNYYNIALAYSKAKNDTGAVAAFKKVVDLDSTNIYSIINVSNLTFKLGNISESIKYLKMAIEIEPENVSYLGSLCGKLFQEKKHDELIGYGQKWYNAETGNKQIPAQYVYQAAKSTGNKEIEKKFEKILRELQ